MSKFVKRDNSGKVWLRYTVNQDWILVSNQSEVVTRVQKKNKPRNVGGSNFKLVTVRKLTELSLETVTARLKVAQQNLEKSAVIAKFPIPAPVVFPTGQADLINYFSVYVDEDLYGTNEPIFTFFCDSYQTQIKAYITANGENINDW